MGDYQIAGKGSVSVDTKYGIPELASNCFQEHERFRDECERAQRCGIKLIVLTEEVPPNGRLKDWRSPLGKDGKPKYLFNPETLQKVTETMSSKYGVEFRFCDGRSTGRVLLELLRGGDDSE